MDDDGELWVRNIETGQLVRACDLTATAVRASPPPPPPRRQFHGTGRTQSSGDARSGSMIAVSAARHAAAGTLDEMRGDLTAAQAEELRRAQSDVTHTRSRGDSDSPLVASAKRFFRSKMSSLFNKDKSKSKAKRQEGSGQQQA